MRMNQQKDNKKVQMQLHQSNVLKSLVVKFPDMSQPPLTKKNFKTVSKSSISIWSVETHSQVGFLLNSVLIIL